MSVSWALASVLVLVVGGSCASCDPPRPIPIDAAIPDAPLLCLKGSLDLAVTTLAGCEIPGDEDGSRDEARFKDPVNVELVGDGSVYLADFDNSLVRVIQPDGTTTTLVKQDNFARPFGLAVAPDGTLYVETDDNDLDEHSETTGTIWRVDPATGAATVITRNVGRPRGLAVLPDGRIAMADHVHHRISILDPATGIVTPLAGLSDTPGHVNGTGEVARFAQPYDLVVNADGDLIVSELDNHLLRRVTLAGVVTDYAGSGTPGAFDGPLDVASFDGPQALALGPDGAIYVTDVHRFYIRRVADGMVETVAGDGTRGYLDSNDPRGARFYGLEGAIADDQRLIVSDGNIGDDMPFHRIRVIRLSALAP